MIPVNGDGRAYFELGEPTICRGSGDIFKTELLFSVFLLDVGWEAPDPTGSVVPDKRTVFK